MNGGRELSEPKIGKGGRRDFGNCGEHRPPEEGKQATNTSTKRTPQAPAALAGVLGRGGGPTHRNKSKAL